MTDDELDALHDLSSKNGKSVRQSVVVGCFDCKSIFSASEFHENDFVEEFDDKQETATCPRCSTDSILPDHSMQIPITHELLKEMHKKFFDQ